MVKRWGLLRLLGVACVDLDYLEIGTADFDTLAQQLQTTEAKGLSVEPVEEHFLRLPSAASRWKLQAAIAEEDGEAELWKVRSEYMEPQCSAATVQKLGLPYCLPWWFRATASLHRPNALVETHLGPKLALDAQEVVKVPTLRYASLLQRYNVTSIHMLKVDTEGFDVFILKQVLRHGADTGHFPERLQFERNNLTDDQQLAPLFAELQASYDCWAPQLEDDVHCMRLGDVAPGQPVAAHGAGGWWRVQLPERLQVARVEIPDVPDLLEVRVGDHPEIWRNPRCHPLRCGLAGRYVAVIGADVQQVQVYAPRTSLGAFRLLLGRVCCHRGCGGSEPLFQGYEPRCEQRCRKDDSCRFFSTWSSLWCATYADCDEDLVAPAAVALGFSSPLAVGEAMTFGIAAKDLVPVPLSQARQSSEDWQGLASRAIDGNFEPHFLRGSCSHTKQESANTWWAARLAFPVAAVRVLGRWDCCHERWEGGWLLTVGQASNAADNPACAPRQRALAPGARRFVRCEGEGYLGLVLPSGEPLTICEIEAFAHFRW
ncbi:unnamed protein product [Effrenium voratum]|uniref:Fucolectin tachylectin-4 pentraxin-1 domain-containing protein n=1 Tax=Effrenium voratum TaxID=2562239 RepID=A0AA36HND2_9DINO|nr:unnamed protein product [Effrenium voratum]